MASEQEQFEGLRRMLVLKRYEVPPPGFLDRLSARVQARLEGELVEQARPWWQRWLASPAWRPAFSGACALGALGWVAWKAALEPVGPPGSPARLAQEAVSAPQPPPLFASPLGGREASAGTDSTHPHLGTAPPPWLFKPALRRPALPVVEDRAPAIRWQPHAGQSFLLVPLSPDTNVLVSP